MWVTLIAAQSLDGCITRHDVPGDTFSSPADKAQFSTEVRRQDSWIMGGESYRWMQSQRKSNQPWRQGLRRIVRTRSPEDYAADAVPGVLEFSDAAPAELVARLVAAGCQRCALLGGGQVYGQFLAAGLVDEIILTVEPQLFGQGRSLTGSLALDVNLKLRECTTLNEQGTLRLRYEVVK